jgi:hypothetical protein
MIFPENWIEKIEEDYEIVFWWRTDFEGNRSGCD